jgi:cytochrome c5
MMKATSIAALGATLGLSLATALGIGAGIPKSAHGQSATSEHAEDPEGKRLFRADCAGCHKWHGNGGGGYGGAALSLRRTQLSRDQMIETVRCGRPGTGMPYHMRDAYEDHNCYGLSKQDLGKDIPMAANAFLRPGEIAAIVDYVIAHVKGLGDPNYEQCIAFFGEGSRVCNIYKNGQQ